MPLTLAGVRREISLYVVWYGEHRPNMALAGQTPHEVYHGLRPANENPRFEPRPRWPRQSRCASPQAGIHGKRGPKLRLVVGYLEGRKHLPVVELQRAA